MTVRLKDFPDLKNKSICIHEREDGSYLTVIPHWAGDDSTLLRLTHSNGHVQINMSTEKIVQLRDMLNSILTEEPRVVRGNLGGSVIVVSGGNHPQSDTKNED